VVFCVDNSGSMGKSDRGHFSTRADAVCIFLPIVPMMIIMMMLLMMTTTISMLMLLICMLIFSAAEQ
jgi:hypothetical protein